jgi:hypothetical protein
MIHKGYVRSRNTLIQTLENRSLINYSYNTNFSDLKGVLRVPKNAVKLTKCHAKAKRTQIFYEQKN